MNTGGRSEAKSKLMLRDARGMTGCVPSQPSTPSLQYHRPTWSHRADLLVQQSCRSQRC